jgi:hypothetical protein
MVNGSGGGPSPLVCGAAADDSPRGVSGCAVFPLCVVPCCTSRCVRALHMNGEPADVACLVFPPLLRPPLSFATEMEQKSAKWFGLVVLVPVQVARNGVVVMAYFLSKTTPSSLDLKNQRLKAEDCCLYWFDG